MVRNESLSILNQKQTYGVLREARPPVTAEEKMKARLIHKQLERERRRGKAVLTKS